MDYTSRERGYISILVQLHLNEMIAWPDGWPIWPFRATLTIYIAWIDVTLKWAYSNPYYIILTLKLEDTYMKVHNIIESKHIIENNTPYKTR